MSTQKTKYDFPAPGSRKAPKFKGHYSQLDDFFEQFETLATSCNLTSGDRFKFIPKYVSSNIRETIEGIQEFKDKKDWDGFVDTFKELYNYGKVNKKFREKDLSQFVKEYKEKSIKNLEKFNKYQRKFTHIAGWTSQIYKKQVGIKDASRDKNLDRSTPYKMKEIIAAAKHVFDTSKFYDDDSSDSDSSDGSDSESGSEDEDEDEDEEDKKIFRKAKASKKNSKGKGKGKSKDMEPRTSREETEDDRINRLIKEMKDLTIQDPLYAGLWLQVIAKRPAAMAFLPQPSPIQGSDNSRANSSAQLGSKSTNNGHVTRRCQKVDEKEVDGTIKRQEDGTIIWPNGDRICREDAETLLEVVNRDLKEYLARTAKVNLFTIKSEEQELQADPGSCFISQVLPAYRAKDERKEEKKKKLIFDGVYPPPLKRKISKPTMEKPAEPTPTPVPETSVNPNPTPPTKPKKVAFSPSTSLQPGQVVVKDGKTIHPKAITSPQSIPSQPTPSIPTPSLPKLQSEFQRQLDSEEFMKKLLSQYVSVTSSELLGSSTIVSKKMQEYLRLTRPQLTNLMEEEEESFQTPRMVNNMQYHHTDSRLICIKAKFDNGLDIMNPKAYLTSGNPMDRTNSITMRDAGQYETKLEGRCHGVNLYLGNLKTTTDLWLYLEDPGREEMESMWKKEKLGTWLAKRNRDGQVVWELWVVPSKAPTEFIHANYGWFFEKEHPEGATLDSLFVEAMDLANNIPAGNF
ncbi:hypothetical protein M422DRAFT_53307 [Sphaerobolus stellatus SS14]|uniref:Uncharacterized protein n=1 Tax=Sphaerobolus stellatus (strain SS14) TaxID=990650 RepID=A0A0C9UAS4_SPHS4|nr:hypothetical protein M422DRAFT_53307 [Sphaerobolus stellatus SS14]